MMKMRAKHNETGLAKEPPQSKDRLTDELQASIADRIRMPRIPARKYRPYQNSVLETPLLHRILEPLYYFVRPFLAVLFRIRSILSQPFQIPLIPRSFQSTLLRSLPVGVVWLVHQTAGDLILGMPLLVCLWKSYHYTFVNVSLSDGGTMATYAIYMAYLTANKTNSLFSFLFGIPFERMIALHSLSSSVAIVCGCLHAYTAYKFGDDSDHARFGSDPNLLLYFIDRGTNVSGTAILGCIMFTFSISFFPFVRRWLFNVWYVLHIALGMGTLLALFYHSVGSVVVIAAWWGLDWLVRYVVMANFQFRTQAQIRLIGSSTGTQVIELRFAKASMAGFDYTAGQFVQICIPTISWFEFHPFSISSAPHEEYATLHIRALGDWTHKLAALAEKQETAIPVCLEGPYGSLAVDIDDDERYRMVILVSGGIGVTPCQSIGKSLLHEHYEQGRHLKYMHFVWAVRDLKMVTDLQPLDGRDYSSSCPTHLYYDTCRRLSENDSGSAELPLEFMESTSPDVSYSHSGSSGKVKHRSPALVQVDIHSTRQKDHLDEQQVATFNLHAGRPDLNTIFLSAKKRAIEMGETNIAVFGCGPLALMNGLQEACVEHSSSIIGCGGNENCKIFFDFHRERFEF